MIIKIKTKPNRNGNSYGLIFDTDKKEYRAGYGICSSWDLHATRTEIDQLIKFNLKINGYIEKES